MSRKKVILRYLFSFFLIALGILVGIVIFSRWHFPIEETLNLMDLITLITTIFLAVYIPEVLDRKLQISRDKKELIEHRLEDLQTLYRRINVLVQSADVYSERDILMINNTLDICQHRLETISTLIGYSKFKYSFDKEMQEIISLSKEHRSTLWTDKIDENAELNLKNVQGQEEILYNKIDQQTCLLIFKLSEA